MKNHKNQPRTMRNKPGTMKTQRSPPETMKNQPGTMIWGGRAGINKNVTHAGSQLARGGGAGQE